MECQKKWSLRLARLRTRIKAAYCLLTGKHFIAIHYDGGTSYKLFYNVNTYGFNAMVKAVSKPHEEAEIEASLQKELTGLGIDSASKS